MIVSKRIYCFVFFMLVLAVLNVRAQNYETFLNPDNYEAKPWRIWNWQNGAVTKERITEDLEYMSQYGFGGAYLRLINNSIKPENDSIRQMTTEWYGMIDWAMEECERLDLKLGISIAPGNGVAGGSWIRPEESMQRIVMTQVNDSIGETIGYYSIPARYLKGESFFTDIISSKKDDTNDVDIKVVGEDVMIDSVSGGFHAAKSCIVDYSFDSPVTVSALEFVLPHNQRDIKNLIIKVGDSGTSFEKVKEVDAQVSGFGNTDCYSTHSIPTTTARYWRLEWNPTSGQRSEVSEPSRLDIKKIIFHPAPRVEQWEIKSGLGWGISNLEQGMLETFDYIPMRDVLEVSSRHHINKNDFTKFYFRLASMSNGQVTSEAGSQNGLECDKFSREAIKKQFESWYKMFYTAAVPDQTSFDHEELAKRILRFAHIGHWECGGQNWSTTFADEFRKRRGYSLQPYLPLMMGFPLEDESTTENVLRDVRRTIGELTNDVFYAEINHLVKNHDCKMTTENIGPAITSDGLTHYRFADYPTAYVKSLNFDDNINVSEAVSAGHIYGKRIIQANLNIDDLLSENPEKTVRQIFDKFFLMGVNKLLIGQNANDTCLFDPRYVQRCQYMLQQGRPVVDLAIFTGEEMPRRVLLPTDVSRLFPGFSTPDSLPMTFNTNPLRGYMYDSFNADALQRSEVLGGRITMESTDDAAPVYSALVIPSSYSYDPDNVAFEKDTRLRLEEIRMMGVPLIDASTLPWTDKNLSRFHIIKDVGNLPPSISFCHRQTDDADIYFLSNQSETETHLRPSFRDSYAREPELWNPADGSVSSYDKEFVLEPYQSVFVVFPSEPTVTE